MNNNNRDTISPLTDCGEVRIARKINQAELTKASGVYSATCITKDGELRWSEPLFENLVTTEGKNFALDTFLSGVGYTVNGPYMGLIDDNANLSVVEDTMSSHASWQEVGLANAPTYSGARKLISWSAASAGSKETSALVSFNITSTGYIGGCFIVLGSGASSSIDTASGVLYSAGAFTEGTRQVQNGDILNVGYSTGL